MRESYKPTSSLVGTRPPRVTVVTVVRNASHTIRGTIDSVLAQTYEDFEYWVIDGASDDGTVDVLNSYGRQLSHWISEPDRGIAEGFNKGLARATGDYIMFLNGDDELVDSNTVASVMALAIEHGCPDVVYGDCDLYDHTTGQRLYRACIEYDRKSLLRGYMLPHPGMFVHRRYFERFGLFDLSFRIAMDYELLIRGVPEVGATHVPLLVTRVRTGGVSTRHRALVVEEVIRALTKNQRFRFWFEPLVLRSRYALRYVLRRVAETLGLYAYWHKGVRLSHYDSEEYGARRSA